MATRGQGDGAKEDFLKISRFRKIESVFLSPHRPVALSPCRPVSIVYQAARRAAVREIVRFVV
jgi:hypothetical protein